MKLKSAQIRIKAGPEDGLKEGQFIAYASVFGNKDSYGDVVMPGAFADSLEEWGKGDSVIPLLFGHNMYDPDYNIGGVEAEEDDHGLKVTATLDLESPKAQQTYRLIKGKRINQMSFAYDVIEGGFAKRKKDPDGPDDEDNTEDVFELRKLKLYEVSVVPIGANQETEILAAKAAESARLVADGRSLPEDLKSALLPVYESLGSLLYPEQGKSQDDSAASGTESDKDETRQGKSEDPAPSPSVDDDLAVQLEFLGLKGDPS